MREKVRQLSPREEYNVETFIRAICSEMKLPYDGVYASCAWDAFLTVYRRQPQDFHSANCPGWAAAYQAISDELSRELSCHSDALYRETSLDQSLSPNEYSPLSDFIPDRLSTTSSRAIIEEFFSLLSKDANTFLKEKLYGLTLLEIQRRHDWSDDYMESLHEEIKRLAQEYFI